MNPADTLRIVQVSDTHLSAERAWFQDNWDVFVNEMCANPPDLIVWTGDVSLRGSHGEEDIAFARTEMDRLPCPTLVLPGNHDIGEPRPPSGEAFDNPERERAISPELRARWHRHFGADWWMHDAGDWRLYGLNAQLFGSGLDAEDEQFAFLEDALAGADGRPGLVFLHKPLYWADPADETRGLYCLYPPARKRLMPMLARHGVRMVASGHLHFYRTASALGMRMVWAPATAFINTKRKKRPPIKLKRRVGYVEITLAGKRASHRLVEPRLFVNHDMHNWSLVHGTTVTLPPRPLARLAPDAR
jgi:3',5'-cyclic AMP phosphodiesterase CpdA